MNTFLFWEIILEDLTLNTQQSILQNWRMWNINQNVSKKKRRTNFIIFFNLLSIFNRIQIQNPWSLVWGYLAFRVFLLESQLHSQANVFHFHSYHSLYLLLFSFVQTHILNRLDRLDFR